LASVDHNKALCRKHGLIYVEASALKLCRRKCGRGFSYSIEGGKALTDKAAKRRIQSLAIPPAWTDVRIAEAEKAHLQAIGRDAEGRLQYRYHPDWDIARAETKEQRLLRFGKALPRVRRAVKRALAEPGLTRDKIVAAIVRLMDRASLRPGHAEYARADGGRGATTLLKGDVSVEADTVVLDFHAKSGKRIQRVVRDAVLAGVLKQLGKWRGKRLFALPGKDAVPVSARDVNAFLAEASGLEVSAKDFRTFRASAGALAMLSEHNGGSDSAKRKAVIEAADAASLELANTRAVARSSYIHPRVIAAYEAGKLAPSLLKGRVRNGLNRIESALLRFLEAKRM
jgi:DNA topoisomerase-1